MQIAVQYRHAADVTLVNDGGMVAIDRKDVLQVSLLIFWNEFFEHAFLGRVGNVNADELIQRRVLVGQEIELCAVICDATLRSVCMTQRGMEVEMPLTIHSLLRTHR